MTDDYKKGYADAMGWKTENHLEHLPSTTPTAWLNKERDVITFDNLFPEMTPLYEKREWVGLTDEEKDGKRVLENGLLFNTAEVQVWELAVQWAETKLKEKNT